MTIEYRNDNIKYRIRFFNPVKIKDSKRDEAVLIFSYLYTDIIVDKYYEDLDLDSSNPNSFR